MIGAFFMATDYVTSPISRLGKTLYGLMIGILGGVFRIWGAQTDSFSYSIIIGNLFTPIFDMYIIQKPYAYRARAIRLRNGGIRQKRIPKAVIALCIITLVAGLALSSVYTVTKDTIQAKKEEEARQSYLAVCPGAATFEMPQTVQDALEDLDGAVYKEAFGRVFINTALEGKDASGATVGYVISVTSADGNDDVITLTVGIDRDGTVNGISFTELNETPGMGMNAGEPEFMDQFSGKQVSQFKLIESSGASAQDEIDAISGATVTSRAVVNAVNAGLDFCDQYMRGGKSR